MELSLYQTQAQKTDRTGADQDEDGTRAMTIPMLGLAGEAGALLSEFKKHLRDGESHRMFRTRVCEELGDILWYLANVATKFDLTLDEVAARNLEKSTDAGVSKRLAHHDLTPLSRRANAFRGNLWWRSWT